MIKKWLFDVRVAAIVVSVWSSAIVVLLVTFRFTESPFFRLGPNATLRFFDNPVDTWPKYIGLCFYVVMQQIVQTYGLETITPFMINEVQNRSVKILPESSKATLSVITVWYTYLWLGRIISIQLLLSQFDLLVLVLCTDLTVTFLVTKYYYLNRKHTGVTDMESGIAINQK